MLGKKERLTRAMFDRSFSIGKRVHHPLLQIIHDTSDVNFHGSVVVGKKVHKRAVDRNRLRRQVYGLLYRHHKECGLTGTYIIIMKPAAKTATKNQVRDAVNELLKKILVRT